MKKRGKQILAALMSALMIVQLPGVSGFLNDNPGTAYADTYRQATVSATTLNVRSGPSTGNPIVKKLSYGTSVTVMGEQRDSAGTTWYKIRFTSGTDTKEGYASSEYISFPTTYTHDQEFERYLTQQGFPESYKDSLRAIHAKHPTWVFQAQKTGLDWNEVIRNEAEVGANLVGSSSKSSWKSTEYGAYDWNTGKWTGFDGASWVAASEEIVCYYMDPRNFLNEVYIFQFLNHNYDDAHQTMDGLESMVEGTFLDQAVVSGGSGSVDYSDGPGAFGNTEPSVSPGSSGGPGASGSAASSSGGPGASGASTSSGGPGASGSAAGSEGPGSAGSTAGTGSPSEETPGSVSTEAPSSTGGQSNVQQISPSGTTSGNVSLEGPSATISARQTNVLAVPDVEYGPGMDASSITGDRTGESSTSPVPEGQTYSDIIMKAAAQSGVNPYVLCAMIIQEQGKGTSGSISGKTAGYTGYYNFFNIGAYQAGNMSAVTRGLWYASQSGSYGRPWNSIEKSIVGGAMYYGDNYVKQGQDTFYLKKFNVQGDNLYKHQYMTNVEGAAGEGAKLARAYTDDMKSETLVFKIPVYNNMPETACAKPAGDGSPNNKLSGLSVTGYALTPTFNMNTESYDIIVNPSVERIEVKASLLDSKASVTGVGMVEIQSGNNTINVDVKAENGTVRTYKLNVVRQSNAPAVNVSGPGYSSAGSVSAGGPGAASSATAPGGTTGPGAPVQAPAETTPAATTPAVPETTAAVTAETVVSVTGPGSMGQNQNVEVGAAPGGNNTGVESGNAPGSSSAPQGSAAAPTQAAPAPTQAAPAPTQAAPAPTQAATQAPTQAATQAPTQAATQAPTQAATQAPTQAAPAPTQAAPAPTQAPTQAATQAPTQAATQAPTQAATQAPTQASTQAAQSASLKKGDCNGDGAVTILDLLLINKQVLGQNVLSGSALTAADLNGDGKVTSADASAMQKLIFGQ